MIDWQSYGPIYTVAPGIKKIGDLPIIEFDQEEQRYLNLKRKVKDNIFFDSMYTDDHDQIICKKTQSILSQEYPSKQISDVLRHEGSLYNAKGSILRSSYLCMAQRIATTFRDISFFLLHLE